MHGLASIVATVGNDSEAFIKALFGSHFLDDTENLRQHRTVSRFWLSKAGDVPDRNGQQMNRRLRVDVFEDNDIFIPVDYLRRDFTRNYSAKQALFHIRLHCTSALLASQQNSLANIIPFY